MIAAIVAIILSLTLLSTRVLAVEFYIVHDRTTQKCTVAPGHEHKKINLASDATYKTRREAESAMKAIKMCSPEK